MFLSRGGHSRSYPRHDLLLFNCELVLSRNLGFGMPRGCELNVKMSITWDGIHHGTRQGDTESPKYGDLSAVWGEKGPRGKPYLGDWGFFQYKKGSISIQDIMIYHHVSCRYHDISLCIIFSIMIYHVPRRHMIYRDIIFFFSPCDIMSISCRVLDDTWT